MHNKYIYVYIFELCRYGEMVNDAFQSIMFFQFCTSLSMICFNFYRIMQIEMDSRYVGTILYMVCSLMQIFYYCWFSNEVKLKVRYCQAKIITRCDFFFFLSLSLSLSFSIEFGTFRYDIQKQLDIVE